MVRRFTMFKSIVICALLCGSTLSAEQDLKFPNISVMNWLHSRNQFTVKLKGHLYSLIWKNETHVEVFSSNNTEINASGEKCSFDTRESPFSSIDPSKVLNTAVLGDNQTIAVLGFRNHSSFESDTINRFDYYDVFLLDPINCSYKVIKTELLNKVPSLISYEYKPQLIAHNDSFDVFFAGEEQCSPCRFNSEGEEIKLERKLKMDFDKEFLSFHVRLLDPIDTERNYFYVQNFRNDTAVMKLLNQDFDVVKKRYVNYVIRFVSVNKDVGAPIGICYFLNRDDNTMICERLDFYLNSVLKPISVIAPSDNVIGNATVTLDTLGNTFVAILHGPWLTSQKYLVVFRYDLHGELVEALDMGRIDNGGKNISRDRTVELDSYIVESMQGQYCVVAYEFLGATADHHGTHIKCFPAAKDE